MIDDCRGTACRPTGQLPPRNEKARFVGFCFFVAFPNAVEMGLAQSVASLKREEWDAVFSELDICVGDAQRLKKWANGHMERVPTWIRKKIQSGKVAGLADFVLRSFEEKTDDIEVQTSLLTALCFLLTDDDLRTTMADCVVDGSKIRVGQESDSGREDLIQNDPKCDSNLPCSLPSNDLFGSALD